MNNIEKAHAIISSLIGDLPRVAYALDIDWEALSYDITRSLDNYDLLMPDLPKPYLHRPYDSFIWDTTEPIIADRNRTVVELGRYEWTPDEAREMALALLAAAEYAEKEQP